MRLIFMGTSEYAKVILSALDNDENCDLVAVCTPPDKKIGRKRILSPSPVKVFAQERQLKLLQPANVNTIVQELACLNADFIVVAAYGQLLKKDLLNLAPCINLHASLLPKYRGASPIQSSILNGDELTGVTAMLMDEGLDSGAILATEQLELKSCITTACISQRLSYLAASLTLMVLQNFTKIKPIAQDLSQVSHCSKITKADAVVNFDDAVMIDRKFRAFAPNPSLRLASGLILENLSLHDQSGSFQAGEILEINKDFIIVGCTCGSLKISQLKAAGKKAVKAYDFVQGRRLKLGMLLD